MRELNELTGGNVAGEGDKHPKYLSLKRKRRSLLASPWNHPSLALQALICPFTLVGDD
jgi:hypothetical protein